MTRIFKKSTLRFSGYIAIFIACLSCTPKTDNNGGEMYFPGCFEGNLDDMRGNTIKVNAYLSSGVVQLEIDKYSIPSGARMHPQCNAIAANDGDIIYPYLPWNYTPISGEPANPCSDIPSHTIAKHDWINDMDGRGNKIILEYDVTATITAWKGHTRGWDGIIRGKLSTMIIQVFGQKLRKIIYSPEYLII